MYIIHILDLQDMRECILCVYYHYLFIMNSRDKSFVNIIKCTQYNTYGYKITLNNNIVKNKQNLKFN